MLMLLGAVVMACSEEEAAPVDSSTTSPPTTAETTTSSSTTSSTTTVDPIAEAEAAVEAAYYRSYDVYVGCYRTLPDCDPEEAFAEVYTDGLLKRVADVAVQRKADGLVYEPPDDPSHARTEILSIDVDSTATEATVTYCTIAGDKEFAISPDGSRVPVGVDIVVVAEWGEALFKTMSRMAGSSMTT